ncbi:MAG TPA: hypothetical protein VGZ00_02045 [Candidatus Baltobacteraceae bacterium]|nr:hypothetical protein [Candidatus Baltobacteraceae bacterium]
MEDELPPLNSSASDREALRAIPTHPTDEQYDAFHKILLKNCTTSYDNFERLETLGVAVEVLFVLEGLPRTLAIGDLFYVLDREPPSEERDRFLIWVLMATSGRAVSEPMRNGFLIQAEAIIRQLPASPVKDELHAYAKDVAAGKPLDDPMSVREKLRAVPTRRPSEQYGAFSELVHTMKMEPLAEKRLGDLEIAVPVVSLLYKNVRSDSYLNLTYLIGMQQPYTQAKRRCFMGALTGIAGLDCADHGRANVIDMAIALTREVPGNERGELLSYLLDIVTRNPPDENTPELLRVGEQIETIKSLDGRPASSRVRKQMEIVAFRLPRTRKDEDRNALSSTELRKQW